MSRLSKKEKKEENARETGIKLRFFSLSSAKRDDLNKKTNYTQLLFIVFRVHMAACITGKRWASAGGRCHHRSASSFRHFFEYFRRALFAFKLVPCSRGHGWCHNRNRPTRFRNLNNQWKSAACTERRWNAHTPDNVMGKYERNDWGLLRCDV